MQRASPRARQAAPVELPSDPAQSLDAEQSPGEGAEDMEDVVGDEDDEDDDDDDDDDSPETGA